MQLGARRCGGGRRNGELGVLAVVPSARVSEFVDEPDYGLLEVEPL